MKWKAIRNIVGIIILLFVVSGNIVFAADTTPPTAPTIEFIAPEKYASDEWTTEYVSFNIIDGKDAESGVNRSEYRTFLQKESEWTTYTTPVWITDSGTTQVDARTIDNEGNISSHSTVTIKIDKPPKGNIVINKGDIATTSTQVTLTIDATDDLGSAAQMQFSNDGVNWSVPEEYATTKEWTLESGDGLKTVYAKFCDNSGNWSDIYVYGTGRNGYGQLGINNTTDSKVLVQTWNISGIKAVSAGGSHTVALKGDGTIWTWGNNGSGQLGDNTTTQRNTPVQVKDSTGVTFLIGMGAEIISAGGSHTVALKEDGTVWAWGSNSSGELGDDTTTQRNIPVQVKGKGGTGFLTGVKTISAGSGYTVALKEDGTLWAWGNNSFGQLGDGTTTQKNTPIQVKGEGGSGFLTGVKAISTGDYHTVALKEDGTVWTWGSNSLGQLGDDTTTQRNTPVGVLGESGKGFLTGVKTISAGSSHTVALKEDGTVWAWGDNDYGQLGDNTTTQSSTPVRVTGEGGAGFLIGVRAISAECCHTVALKEDGTVWAWGINGYGQLGDNTTENRKTPVQVLGKEGTGYLANIESIDAGVDHTVFKFGILDYIYYDTTPPTVPTIEFTSPSGYISDSWTNQNVTFTIIDGTDDDSGVNRSEYRTSLDGGDWNEWTTYTTAVTITDAGVTSVEARTIDNAENIGSSATATINIDKTAPTGAITINNGDAYTPDTSVALNLSAVDMGGAGIHQMMFSNDNTNWSTDEAYSTSKIWSLQAGGEDTRTVYVKFSDNAGNWSPVYSDTIIYDSIAPGTPVIAFASPSGYKSAEWTEQNVTFTISNGSDGGSGANYSEYRISFNSGAWGEWTKYISAVTISMEGSTTVEARTVDKAGNTGSAVSVTINIDKTAPQAPAIQFTQPGGYISGTWTNKDVTFTITHGFDGTHSSGVDNTEYRMSFNGAPFGVWATYTTPITVTAEGITDFEARTTDNLGHVGAMSSVSISIDKTIPGKPNIKFIAPDEYININK